MTFADSKADDSAKQKNGNVEFVDPEIKKVDRIWDVTGDNMLFGKLSNGDDDSIVATLMEVDFLTIKENMLTVSMKDVDEAYKRNLAQLKNYNKNDFLKGVITDAAVLADA